jgi:hypothetical protein
MTKHSASMSKLTALVAAALWAGVLPAAQPGGADSDKTKTWASEINTRIAENYTYLETLYKHLHTHPELSLGEVQTSARLAKEIAELGFEVTPKVGGHGLVSATATARRCWSVRTWTRCLFWKRPASPMPAACAAGTGMASTIP